jgi:peptide methionine sulfoxide reductase MsrA
VEVVFGKYNFIFKDLKEWLIHLQGIILHIKNSYCGGNIEYPSYKLICTGATGHAEVVLVHYDPSVITLHTILGEFF